MVDAPSPSPTHASSEHWSYDQATGTILDENGLTVARSVNATDAQSIIEAQAYAQAHAALVAIQHVLRDPEWSWEHIDTVCDIAEAHGYPLVRPDDEHDEHAPSTSGGQP